MPKSLGWYFAEQLILKITLIGCNPKIWRRVEVHSGLTLHDLHYVIQATFEWQNSHLYQFHVPPGGKLTYKARREATRYHILPEDDFSPWDEGKDRPADEMLVGRVFTPECKQIIYEYDFGDSWEHLVKLEKRTKGGDQDHIPQCLAGENAGPPEDSGGIHGFYQKIEAYLDPNDDYHDEAVEWLGDNFDSSRFDIERINRDLNNLFAPTPKRTRKPRKKKS